ncbi:MAG TPA: hypothetical protein VLI04_22965 [Nocardioidaceae bacterium]|nr:hypothetical protein [Nocardioidaceae bacterium]
MDPWVYVAIGAAIVVALGACLLVLRASGRSRAELRSELSAARGDVRLLTDRLEALTVEVAESRRVAEERASHQEIAPLVITGVVAEPEAETVPREAQIVHAIEVSRPQWVPAAPLRETLIKTVSLSHGLRRALSPNNRDRIVLEMRAEVRRSRRQRRAEMKAVRKYLRERRKSTAA